MSLQAVDEEFMTDYFPKHQKKIPDKVVTAPLKPDLFVQADALRKEISKNNGLKKPMSWGDFISGIIEKFIDEYQKK